MTQGKAPPRGAGVPSTGPSANVEQSFSEVDRRIERARLDTLQGVNSGLVDLYWELCAQISAKIESAGWGEGVENRLARYLAQTVAGARGFSAFNLWRMRQLFEGYRHDPKLAPLVQVLPWTYNLIIFNQSKLAEECEFYHRSAFREGRTQRELERQHIRACSAVRAKTRTSGARTPRTCSRRGIRGRLHTEVPRSASRPTGGRSASAGCGRSCASSI